MAFATFSATWGIWLYSNTQDCATAKPRVSSPGLRGGRESHRRTHIISRHAGRPRDPDDPVILPFSRAFAFATVCSSQGQDRASVHGGLADPSFGFSIDNCCASLMPRRERNARYPPSGAGVPSSRCCYVPSLVTRIAANITHIMAMICVKHMMF